MTERTCGIDGCERKHFGRGWCRPHYVVWYRTGDPLTPPSKPPYNGTACVVEGCELPARSCDRCPTHYARFRRHGGIDVAPSLNRNVGQTCSVTDCLTPAKLKGLCEKHERRVRLYGDPDGQAERYIADELLTYFGAHRRVRLLRGPARQYRCVDGCGNQARDWSYDHACSREQVDSQGLPFSPDPNRYQPRCRACHIVFDSSEVGYSAWTMERINT
jgi:hypothetical protein